MLLCSVFRTGHVGSIFMDHVVIGIYILQSVHYTFDFRRELNLQTHLTRVTAYVELIYTYVCVCVCGCVNTSVPAHGWVLAHPTK
jgi:hypothetical protein